MDISKLSLYTSNRSQVYSDKLRKNMENVLKRAPASAITEVIDSYTKEIMKAGSCITINIPGSYDKFRAETYNALMDEIKLDFKSLYADLDSMISLLNNLSYVVETYYKETESDINILNSRIKALSSLQTTSKEYDEIVFETFTNQTNKHTGKSALTIPNESGIMRLPVDEHMSVYAEDNDADVSLDILNHVTLLSERQGSPSETDPALAIVKEVFTDQLQSCTYTIGVKGVGSVTNTYNGVVAILSLAFPSSRHFNNISFNPYSNAEMDILGIYYTNSLQGSYTDSIWESIDHLKYDTDNFNSYEFNFEQKLGKRIIIIFGQSHYRTETIRIPKEIFNISNRSSLSIATVERDRLKEYRATFERIMAMVNSYKSDEQIKAALYDNNLSNMVGDVDKRIQLLLLALEEYVNKEENQYLEIKADLYKIGVYSLDIQYNNYRANAYFESEPLIFKKNIRKLQLYVDQQIEDKKNTIEWSVTVNNEKLPIIPFNLYENGNVIIDTTTVFDINEKTYSTKYYAYDSGFVVKINGNIISSDDYTKNMLSTTYLDSITFLPSVLLNRDDVIAFNYTSPSMTKFNTPYDPTQIDFDNQVKPPHVEYQELYNPLNNTNKTIIKSQIDPPIFTTIDNQYVIPYQYEETPGVLIDNNLTFENNPMYSPPSGILEHISISSSEHNRYLITNSQLIFQNQKHHYYGIYNEEIELSDIAGLYHGETSVPYVPGSLTVKYNNNNLFITEPPAVNYFPEFPEMLDITSIHINYDEFGGVLDTPPTVLCTYVPFDFDINNKPSGYVSNISTHNYEESFVQTSEDNTIVLSNTPHLDKYLISESTNAYSDWIFIDGSFINKTDTSIIYQPVVVYVNGDMVRNVTNYQDTQSSKNMNLDTYNESLNNIEYYHQDNKLFFNTKIISDILIKYYKSHSNITITAQAIRHTKTDDTITPSVYSYAVLADLE